jgi:hypothetical protein
LELSQGKWTIKMITTYDNVKLKANKRVLNQMLEDYILNLPANYKFMRATILDIISVYWNIDLMTNREKNIIKDYISYYYFDMDYRIIDID